MLNVFNYISHTTSPPRVGTAIPASILKIAPHLESTSQLRFCSKRWNRRLGSPRRQVFKLTTLLLFWPCITRVAKGSGNFIAPRVFDGGTKISRRTQAENGAETLRKFLYTQLWLAESLTFLTRPTRFSYNTSTPSIPFHISKCFLIRDAFNAALYNITSITSPSDTYTRFEAKRPSRLRKWGVLHLLVWAGKKYQVEGWHWGR